MTQQQLSPAVTYFAHQLGNILDSHAAHVRSRGHLVGQSTQRTLYEFSPSGRAALALLWALHGAEYGLPCSVRFPDWDATSSQVAELCVGSGITEVANEGADCGSPDSETQLVCRGDKPWATVAIAEDGRGFVTFFDAGSRSPLATRSLVEVFADLAGPDGAVPPEPCLGEWPHRG